MARRIVAGRVLDERGPVLDGISAEISAAIATKADTSALAGKLNRSGDTMTSGTIAAGVVIAAISAPIVQDGSFTTGQTTISMPASVPTGQVSRVHLRWGVVEQTAGVDYTTDGTATLHLSSGLTASIATGDTYHLEIEA